MFSIFTSLAFIANHLLGNIVPEISAILSTIFFLWRSYWWALLKENEPDFMAGTATKLALSNPGVFDIIFGILGLIAIVYALIGTFGIL
ncbi:hypothetical protein ACFL13_01640 [Patescibacteria group bacterium]